jgi:hypothetical protein
MRRTYFFLPVMAGILAGISACAQRAQTPPVKTAGDTADTSDRMVERILAAGTALLGKPYQYNTLDTGKEEHLIVNLAAFDCVTFVETVFARALAGGDTSDTVFRSHLQQCRYRDGIINGYASRLHYFSDWFYEQERQGRLQILTDSTNGIPLPKPVNYMSVHRKSYPRLAEESAFRAITEVEKQINRRTMYYIPKNQPAAIEKMIREGDIIAITSSIRGLDIAHSGFAIRQDGRIHLLHASSEHHRVIITAEPLTEYLMRNRLQTGVMVGRVISY